MATQAARFVHLDGVSFFRTVTVPAPPTWVLWVESESRGEKMWKAAFTDSDLPDSTLSADELYSRRVYRRTGYDEQGRVVYVEE